MTRDTSTITASFSSCGRYRYLLRWPTGVESSATMLFIGANPSKAGQVVDCKTLSDPTVSQMHGRAERMGFGVLEVCNVRAWIATDPHDVPDGPMAIEHEDGLNAAHIVAACERASLVVCAWGQLAGKKLSDETLDRVRRSGKCPYVLDLTRDGFPRHPRGVLLSVKPFAIWMAE